MRNWPKCIARTSRPCSRSNPVSRPGCVKWLTNACKRSDDAMCDTEETNGMAMTLEWFLQRPEVTASSGNLTPGEVERMAEEGTLSIVRHAHTYQVRYASYDHESYLCHRRRRRIWLHPSDRTKPHATPSSRPTTCSVLATCGMMPTRQSPSHRSINITVCSDSIYRVPT